MSVTDGESEAANRQQQQEQRNWFKVIQDYFEAMGLPQSPGLSEHATHMHHEDVPDGAVQAPQVGAVQTLDSGIPVQAVDPRCPNRLHPLFPPKNYGAVVPRAVYRSSFPQPENFEFLQGLKLKTILTLVDGDISPEYQSFMDKNGIQHFRVPIQANKGSVKVQTCQLSKALGIVLDRTNHPLLIHCNKGKHRTGCVVGLIRRIQGYDESKIWEEYHAYADDKARILDECCMEQFDLNTVLWMIRRWDWVLPNAEYIPLPISNMQVNIAKPHV